GSDAQNVLKFVEVGVNDPGDLSDPPGGTEGHHGTYVAAIELHTAAVLDDEFQTAGITGGPRDDGGAIPSVRGKPNVDFGADGAKSVAFAQGIAGVTVTADDGSHPTLQVVYRDPVTGIGTPENITNIVWTADGAGGGTLTGYSLHFDGPGGLNGNNPAFT